MFSWLGFNWPQLVAAAVAVTGAIVAVRGLSTWRAQLRGKTEYEHARRVLRGVFQVREQIAAVRSPFIAVGEMASAYKEAGLEPEAGDFTRDKRTDELVYERRWRSLSTAFTDLQTELLEAEVLWGSEVRNAEGDLRKCVAELYSVIHQHVQIRRGTLSETSLPQDLRDRNFRILYLSSNDPKADEFSGQVAAAVARFEDILRPHLTLQL